MRNTGIDHTVPYTAVVMVRNDAENVPAFTLPEGYRFATFTPADEENWIRLQAEVTHVESLQQGKQIFREEFLQASAGIPCEDCPGYEDVVKRTVQVKDAQDNLVGVATLWLGDTFGEIWQRVHWVAVHPDHQGKGIAKCMIAKMLQIYHELGCDTPIYLTTQTKTYRAVRIYKQMGFVPYMGEKPTNWPFMSDVPKVSFAEENEAAWDLIRKKLEEANLSL